MTVKTYELGNVIKVSGSFTDSNDEPVDPSQVSVSILTPGKSLLSYVYNQGQEVKKEGTGIYYIEINANITGDWYVRFFSSGSIISASEILFRVSSHKAMQ